MRRTVTTRSITIVTLAIAAGASSASAQYHRRDLVSNQPGAAAFTDPNLINGWGVAFNPAGFVWVSSADASKSTLYNGLGQPQSLVVDIPSPGSLTGGNPTGIVFSGSSDFVVNDGLGHSGPSRFLFATENGTIAGWSPTIPPGNQALAGADHSVGGASYKGLALGGSASGNRLFAADFHNARIDTFNSTFGDVTLPFNDPSLPAGYAPFNAMNLGGKLFVTYAQQDATGDEEVTGPGLGLIDVFDFDGNFQQRLVSPGGDLNAPWGMAIAPADFGAFSNALLVGNFGDGRINAFNPITGAPMGPLVDGTGAPIEIDGLWGIAFGNGLQFQPRTTLFFAAGPDDEANGLYGRIDVPAPGSAAVLMSVAALGLGRRPPRRLLRLASALARVRERAPEPGGQGLFFFSSTAGRWASRQMKGPRRNTGVPIGRVTLVERAV
jgi:uncharacterized protein (TIGR03118 family)